MGHSRASARGRVRSMLGLGIKICSGKTHTGIVSSITQDIVGKGVTVLERETEKRHPSVWSHFDGVWLSSDIQAIS